VGAYRFQLANVMRNVRVIDDNVPLSGNTGVTRQGGVRHRTSISKENNELTHEPTTIMLELEPAIPTSSMLSEESPRLSLEPFPMDES
jgi:hypothetical protein